MVFGRGRFWNYLVGKLGLLVAVAADAEDGNEVRDGDVAADIGFVVDLDYFAAAAVDIGLDIAVAALVGLVVEEAVDSYSVVALDV